MAAGECYQCNKVGWVVDSSLESQNCQFFSFLKVSWYWTQDTTTIGKRCSSCLIPLTAMQQIIFSSISDCRFHKTWFDDI